MLPPMSASASLPRPPARCTSAARARRSTTGCSPAARAASSCCGSRTPTASARRPRTSSRSSRRSTGSGSTGTASPSSSPSAPTATPRSSSSCSTPATPTAPPPAPTRSSAFKEANGNRGFRGADEGEGAVRLRVPDEGVTTVVDVIRGETRVRERAPGRPRDRARRRHARLPPRGRRRRPRRRHHARRPRRRPLLQHAQARAHPAGDGRADARSTPTCRCCTGPTARSSPSATARRPCRSCATRGYLPEAVRNYLALLGWGYDEETTFFTTEELQRLLLARARLQVAGGLRRAEAALDERPLRARARRRRPDRAGWRRCTGRTGLARRGRDHAGEDLHARRVLAAGARRSSTARPTIPRRARSSSRPRRARRRSARRATALARRCRSRGPPRRSRRRCAPAVERSGLKAKQVFQPLRVALTGTTISPGIFETVALLGRERALDAHRRRTRRPPRRLIDHSADASARLNRSSTSADRR